MNDGSSDGSSDGFDRLEHQLSHLGLEYSPPPGWETRVLAEVVVRPRRRLVLAWCGGLAALTAAAALWIRSDRVASPGLEVAIESRSTGHRGGALANTGDLAIVKLRHDGARALRIYREQSLVLACPCSGSPSCIAEVDELRAHVELGPPGSYTFVGLTSHSMIPGPFPTLDEDVVTAMAAGASIELARIIVR